MGNKYERPGDGDLSSRDRARMGVHPIAAPLLGTMLITGTMLLGTLGRAEEPPGSEALPPPRPVSLPAVVVPAPSVYRLYTPPLSRDVWRAYDVDYKGFWRPRVAFTPQGDFYLGSGAPFPWAEMYPHWFKSRVRGD